MSEPTTGLPAPAGQPSGISETPGQPQSTPQTPAATPPPTSGATTPPATPAATPAPDAAKLQKERDEAIAYARQLQSERDRLRAAVAGPQAPDPMVSRIKAYTDQGYSETDARFFIGQIDAAVAPILQQNQQLQAAVQGQSQAQQAYQQAVEANPELFADPKVQRAAWEALTEAALAGQTQFVTPGYALSFAAQTWALEKQPWKQAANAPAPPSPQPFRPAGMMSFGGNGSSYAPNVHPHQQQQPEDPAVTDMANKMSMRVFGKPLSEVK